MTVEKETPELSPRITVVFPDESFSLDYFDLSRIRIGYDPEAEVQQRIQRDIISASGVGFERKPVIIASGEGIRVSATSLEGSATGPTHADLSVDKTAGIIDESTHRNERELKQIRWQTRLQAFAWFLLAFGAAAICLCFLVRAVGIALDGELGEFVIDTGLSVIAAFATKVFYTRLDTANTRMDAVQATLEENGRIQRALENADRIGDPRLKDEVVAGLVLKQAGVTITGSG